MGEGLARYVEAYGHAPGWMTKDGWPASWAHYVFAIGHLDRFRSQRKLEMMEAVMMAQTGMGGIKKEQRDTWREEHKLYAGWG